MSAPEELRYYVERPEGQRDAGRFDDVGADGGYEVLVSGALQFKDADGNTLLTYAPHAWIVVTDQ